MRMLIGLTRSPTIYTGLKDLMFGLILDLFIELPLFAEILKEWDIAQDTQTPNYNIFF